MKNIKYLISRILNMNYKNFFKTLDDVHSITNKNKFFIFLDMVYCGIKYKAGYVDYRLFEFYNLNKYERGTIITRGINNDIVRRYNNKEYVNIFHNKLLFNDTFKDFIKRDYMKVTENNYNEFCNFIKKHNEIIIKPLDLSCGKGIEKVSVTKKNIKQIYNNILDSKRNLVEEVATQIEELASFHPYSINTMRVVTLNHKVVCAFLRIGNNKKVVDNFNNDGLVVPIEIKDGSIIYKAIDKNSVLYDKHPVTNKQIKGNKIPKFNEVISFVEEASKIIPEVKYVGWDVSINEDGPYLIEANEFPGHDIYSLPPHRTNNQGLYPVFKEAMKK